MSVGVIMEVKLLEEAGYQAALDGLALNKKQTKDMSTVAEKLAFHDGGHNKFLEHIEIWLMVKAPRYWWQEADTFRLSSKSSESTMHTLMKEIENGSFGVNSFEGGIHPDVRDLIQDLAKNNDLVSVKQHIPEGFLQKRMWKMSYKTLRNIILQRRNHRLPHWQMFIEKVLEQVEHTELLPDGWVRKDGN